MWAGVMMVMMGLGVGVGSFVESGFSTVGATAGGTRGSTAAGTAADRGGEREGEELLREVRDQEFSFDDAAFYWLCRRARGCEAQRELAAGSGDAPVAWRMLMERPSDYRGRVVVVEGILRTRQAFEVSGAGREDVGTLYQSELSDVSTRSFCTVVTTDDPGRLPLRGRVRAKGFFLKVRAYRDTAGQTGYGPLIVGRELSLVEGPVSIVGEMRRGRWDLLDFRDPTNLAAWGVGLVCVWLLLRGLRRAGGGGKAARGGAGRGSEGDFEWMEGSGE